MANADLSKVLEHLRRALPADEGGPGDGHLLARFVAARDEAAFEALVRRHGRMVLGVCRRVLGHAQDAEDAFQAAFLVLARKAGSVVKRESVGSWLYGTAYRTALEARARKARRRAREKQVVALPQPAAAPPELLDWRPLLDEAVNALPEKYRSAVVLCELEGRPRREAAQLLGLPEGTLSSRLAAARRLLAGRLARRGLALSGAALAAAAATERAAADLPAALVTIAVRSALAAAAGQALASGAAALSQGVLKAMWFSKVKAVVAVVMVAVALGACGLACRTGWGALRAAEAARADPDLEALRKENEVLRKSLELALEKIQAQDKEIRALKTAAETAAKTPKKDALALTPCTINAAFSGPIPNYAPYSGVGSLTPFGHSPFATPYANNFSSLGTSTLTPFNYSILSSTYTPLTFPVTPEIFRGTKAEKEAKDLLSAKDREALNKAVKALEKALAELKKIQR
jgi:RNA polymerase sigma factor (sigma-70 family)